MDLNELFDKFSQSIKTNVIYKNKKELKFFSQTDVFSTPDYLEYFMMFFSKFDELNKIYLIRVNESYIVYSLRTKNEHVLIGPFFIKERLNYNHKLSFENFLDVDKHSDISTHELVNTVSFISNCITNIQYKRNQIYAENFQDIDTQINIASKADKNMIKNSITEETSEVFDIVTLVSQIVRNGNVLAIYDIYKDIEKYINTISKFCTVDEIRGVLLGLLAIVTRSCVRGGAVFEVAYLLGKTYLQEYLKKDNVDEMLELTYNMISQYTKLTSDFRQYGSEKENTDSYYVIKTKRYINEHIGSVLKINEIANYLGITPNYLSNLFKESTGQTVSEYIALSKISIAKKMMNYSTYSISDIAIILGYSSQSHFGKKFKEQTGFTPKEYLNNLYVDNYNEFKFVSKTKKKL